jgi:hypothetical protein
MSIFAPVTIGNPGTGTPDVTSTRFVFSNGAASYLPGGLVVDSSKARDVTNAPDSRTLRPGLLMGRITATGRYGSSTIGKTLAAILANATSLSLTPAAAAELLRREGASGNLLLVGPPTAAGTVASQTVAYSAINVATGVVTTSAIPAAVVTDSRVCSTDGSAVVVSMIPDGGSLTMPDTGVVTWPMVPTAAYVDERFLLDYPADASSRKLIRDQLRPPLSLFGNFTFIG